jgi:hypothetical protein
MVFILNGSPESITNPTSKDFSGRRALCLLLLIYGVAVLGRMVLAAMIGGPTIFGDEVTYAEFGRSLAAGKCLQINSIDVSYPCWLYPILIAPFFAQWPFHTAYPGILCLNSVLIALTVFPVYGLARELATRRRALVAAALTSMLPVLGYTGMVMTENLFIPVFALCMWMAFRAVHRPALSRRIVAGLSFGLAFHVKPHGILVPFIFAVTSILFESRHLFSDDRIGKRIWHFTVSIFQHWVTALSWAVVLLPRLWVVYKVEHAPNPFDVSAILGSYYGLTIGERSFGFLVFFKDLLILVLLWIFATGLLPAVVFGREVVARIRERRWTTSDPLFLLVLVATGVILLVIARYLVIYDKTFLMYERYICVIYPLAIIYFCVRFTSTRPGWAGYLVRAAALILFMGFWLWTARPVQWNLPANCPTLSGLLGIYNHNDVSSAILVVMATLSVAAFVVFVWGRKTYARNAWAMAAFLSALNVGWYGTHHGILKPQTLFARSVACKIEEKLPRDHKLLVLADGLPWDILQHVIFRNNSLTLHLSKDDRYWYSHPLELNEPGDIISPYSLDESWFLASTDWKFNKAPELDFDQFALYRIGGIEKLRLERSQMVDHIEDQLSTKKVEDHPILANLLLTYLDFDHPVRFQAGRLNRVRLKIRNDGVRALPSGKIRIGLGYHWSDPDRTGNWQAVVWDDGHNVLLPENLSSRATFDLEFYILAPDNPGKKWCLVLSPFLQQGPNKTWARTNDMLYFVTVAAP